MRKPTFFQRLNWKLTLSYTLVTVGTLLFLELCILLGIQIVASTQALNWTVSGILQNEAVPQLQSTLQNPPFDIGKLNSQLTIWFPTPGDLLNTTTSAEIIPLSPGSEVMILDPQGRLLSQHPDNPSNQLESFVDASRIPGLTKILPLALSGERKLTRLAWRDGSMLTVIVPVISENNLPLGFLVFHTEKTTDLTKNLSGILQLLGLSFAAFTLLAGVIGTLFGFFTARGLTRRLRHVAAVSTAWGKGDFNQTIEDASPDELGQMGFDLNAMSQQLQELMQTRQQLAALDERNRMARDLHDSVKQQVFAIRMNLSAIQSLWEVDPEKARTRLETALQITGQAQQELSELIQALHPVVLETKGLAQSLRDLLADWENSHTILTNCQIDCPVALSKQIELALLRITQEALNNAYKHSEATYLSLILKCDAQNTYLNISDNGHGFDQHIPSAGLGLLSMRERVEALGGTFNIESDAQGTRLIISMPNGV
jgi:two-component system, NarL family, sensor histidine kinase LiaS